MLSLWQLLVVALLLPLFPFSLVFNALFQRLPNAYAQALMLLLWPGAGVWLLWQWQLGERPFWLALWALLTALFYGFRLLAVLDARVWLGFLASSCFALLWLLPSGSVGSPSDLVIPAWAPVWGLVLPLVVLALALAHAYRRFGALHVRSRLALSAITPRLAALLVFALLAAIATPLFPGFFVMLGLLLGLIEQYGLGLLSVLLLLNWLCWTWGAALLIQGVVVGEGQERHLADPALQDLRPAVSVSWGLFMAAFALLGLLYAEVWL